MRLRFSLVTATMLVLAACSDDPGSSPTGVGAAWDPSSVAATCEPATIRYTLATLLTDAGAKAFAIPRFNAGQQADQEGNATLAEQEYFRVVNHVLDRYARGGTAQPKRYDSVQAAVTWVVLALYDCAGATLPIPADDLGDLIDDIGGGGPTGDIGIAVVGPGIDFDVLVPSRQFSFQGLGNYWDEAGLVVVRRIFDDESFSDGVYGEYPPRYNITVTPYTAQANFDDTGDGEDGPEDVVPPGSPDVTALVTICPGTEHPGDYDELFILRRPEAFLEAPLEQLPSATPDPDVVCDAALPDYVSPPVIGAGASRLGAVRGMLASLWRHLGPAPLYAVDGGIGGRVRLASDYVSADAPSLFAFAQLVAIESAPFALVQENALNTTEGQQWTLAASTSSESLVPPAATCAWSIVSNPDGAVSILGDVLTAEDPGTAVVRATCGTETVDVTVTVVPVILG